MNPDHLPKAAFTRPSSSIVARQNMARDRPGDRIDLAANDVRPDKRYPDRRKLTGPRHPYPRSRISRPCSRFQSLAASVSRLSCSFLPLARATSSLAVPFSLK